MCCSEARALRLGGWEHIILRITDLFEQHSLVVPQVFYSPVDGLNGNELQRRALAVPQNTRPSLKLCTVVGQDSLDGKLLGDHNDGRYPLGPSLKQKKKQRPPTRRSVWGRCSWGYTRPINRVYHLVTWYQYYSLRTYMLMLSSEPLFGSDTLVGPFLSYLYTSVSRRQSMGGLVAVLPKPGQR